MDFKVAKINDQNIIRTGSTGILYTSKEWRRLSVSDDSRNTSGYHGRIVSPTYARVRIITLEGIIDRKGDQDSLVDVKYLEELFALQGSFFSTDPLTLYIQDMYNNEWELAVKVQDPLEILEGNEDHLGSHWRWRVVLESLESPIYTSAQAQEILGEESIDGGFTMGTTLGSAWEEIAGYIECTTLGNIDTPAVIEITTTEDITAPIMVKNKTNGTFFGVNGTIENGDVIVIDSKEKTLTKNGVNILGDRVLGSIWPHVKSTTRFVIEDETGAYNGSGFNVKITFSDSLL